MRISLMLVAGSILLVTISGCTSVKRFKSAAYKGQDDSLVDMALFGAQLEPIGTELTGKNLWDLSAGAQTQLIQILNERYPDNEQFTRAMNQEYIQMGAEPVLDFTQHNLRMVFTVSKQNDYSAINDKNGRFSPADRIEYLSFSLVIPPEYGLRFTGWNRYGTEYAEIEIADVSFSRSLDLEAEVSGEIAGGSTKGVVSRREDQVVKNRYLKLNGSISSRKLQIEEEGARGMDLAGNVIAEVSLEFDGFPERVTIPIYSTGEGHAGPQVSSLRFADVMVPRMENAPEEIGARLEMEYVYRHVEAGWKTYQEWDDRVAYYMGKVTRQVSLFRKQEYIPSLYCLGSDVQEKEALRIRTSAGVEYPLQFLNYQEADRFMDWLVRLAGKDLESTDELPGGISPIAIGEYTLLFRDRPLTPGVIKGGDLLKVIPVY